MCTGRPASRKRLVGFFVCRNGNCLVELLYVTTGEVRFFPRFDVGCYFLDAMENGIRWLREVALLPDAVFASGIGRDRAFNQFGCSRRVDIPSPGTRRDLPTQESREKIDGDSCSDLVHCQTGTDSATTLPVDWIASTECTRWTLHLVQRCFMIGITQIGNASNATLAGL